MRNLVNVSNSVKVESLIGIVRDVAPFIIDGIYSTMQKSHYAQWHAYCYDQDETSADFMQDLILSSINKNLPGAIVADILDRQRQAVLYMEVAQFNNMDTDEQANQEEYWEEVDRQADFNDKVNMYYNEY